MSVDYIVHFLVRFPQGLEDVSKYPHLIHELLQRNWTENELAGVLRRNFLLVFEEVERVKEDILMMNSRRNISMCVR